MIILCPDPSTLFFTMPSSTPHHLTLSDVEFDSFDVMSFGTVAAPAKPSKFGFQIDVKASTGMGQIIFGLMQEPNRSSEPRLGFGIRVDLERGEIWDIVNGSGLIGWVEDPVGNQAGGKNEPILFSLEIERIGSALLPKLQIGGEEWLYPAVRSLENLEFTAMAGCSDASHKPMDGEGAFSNASLWCESSDR